MPKDIPLIFIIGKQNAGKTTLISQIIPLLKEKKYRVGSIKYNVPFFEIDYRGKDTYIYYQAGADVVSISSPEKLAVIRRHGHGSPLSIEEIVQYNYQDVDVILVEGYKKWGYPCIEIVKDCKSKEYPNKPGISEEDHLIITSFTREGSPVPVFHTKDLDKIMAFIQSKMK